MLGNVYVLINDRKKGGFTKTYYSHNDREFKGLNKLGRGVYCSVNDFEATDEQMQADNNSTKRNIKYLTKINGVFADLDIAKAGDGQDEYAKAEKKNLLAQALYEVCDPTIIIDTANGLQPIRKLKDSNTTEEYQKRYVDVINSIIEWSKGHGASGDAVKDVTRVLRVPGYYHMKQEPYMVKMMDNEKIYTLEELEEIFLKYKPQEKKRTHTEKREIEKHDQYRQVDALDFHEVIQKAFRAVGRNCEFDNQDRLIIDGRLTGTFVGKLGDKRYLASTSHEPFKGNIVTAVADILQVSTKDAYGWILETFNITTKPKNTIEIEKIENYAREGFLYGNDVFDKFGCVMSGELCVVVAESNSGKTTFAMNMMEVNSNRGKKCFYINLEFPIETMWEGRWLFLNNKSKKNLTDIDPLTEEEEAEKDRYIRDKLSQFAYYNNPQGLGLKELCELVIEKQSEGYTFFVVDSFSRIHGNLDSKIAYTSQNKAIETLQELCQARGIVIVLLHHTNKGGKFEGSQKIMDLSNVFISIEKERDDMDNYCTKFTLTKDKFISKNELLVYYYNQEYTLDPPDSNW